MKPKVIIIPGNGNSYIATDHWYAWAVERFRQQGFEVIAEDMPDPEIAHMNIWLPHIEKHFKADEKSIIVGHSSGGVAALRYLENHRLFGAVVIGVNHTDLGYPEEKEAGWYDAPWQWAKINRNAGWIIQYASTDDPYINIEEPRLIHQKTGSEYYEFTNRGHFMTKEFPELITKVTAKCPAMKNS
jgi:uncharacterized protein